MFKEVFCKDTQFLRKGKARACESLGFVVNKNETISKHVFEEIKNRVDVGSYPQHLSLHRTYGSRIRRYIHIGERKL